jgi:UDP-N-acetylmuramoyl-L-alanyl-D-glutamate--2,6-diaminopimelate ligase
MTALIKTIQDIVGWIRAAAPKAQLASDSRSIQSGDVFVAYPNDEADGRAYISNAIERGAAAVVHEQAGYQWNAEWDVPHLAVEHLKEQAGEIASAYYGQPDLAMSTIAVTGTNGKTSCTQWLGRALSQLGQPTAVIGTLGVGIFRDDEPGTFNATGYTTPDAVLLQRTLADMRDNGASGLAIEASSIGLHQGRLNGTHFDIALFTNFTRDHLDYHGSMDAYEEAKAMLFDWPGLRHAVVNLDDEMGLRLIERIQRNHPDVAVTGYTLTNKSVDGIDVLQANDIRSTQSGTSFQLVARSGIVQVKDATGRAVQCQQRAGHCRCDAGKRYCTR